MTLVAMDDGVRLAVEAAGPSTPRPVLFLHSVGCDRSLWDAPFAALADHRRVVRYDARGHGGSDVPTGDYTPERLAADALAVLDWAGADEAFVCGLSLGATTAMRLALDAPGRLHGMVLAGASARLGTPEGWQARMDAARSQGMEAMADLSMTRFFSDAFREANPDVVARFRAGFARTAPQGYAGCCAALRDADVRADLPRIAAPALVIAGEQDAPTPPADSEALVAGIPGAELARLDAGHLSVVEQGPAFVRLLRAWLPA